MRDRDVPINYHLSASVYIMKEGNEWKPRSDSPLSREEQDAAPWDLGGKKAKKERVGRVRLKDFDEDRRLEIIKASEPEGLYAVPEEIKKQINADHAEYNRRVAEGYERKVSAGMYDKVSPGSADRANDRPAIEQAERAKAAGNLEYDSWKKSAGDIEVDSWKRSPGDIEVDSWRRAGEGIVPPQPEAVPGAPRAAANEAVPPAPGGAPAGVERMPPPLPLGPEGGAALRAAYGRGQEGIQNGERRSVWGWLKERGKGLLTLGFWEVHQAERFRSGTKKTAVEVAAQAELLDQTRDMDIEQAQDEANRIRAMAGGPQGMTKGGIEAASNVIDAEKTASNARLMDRIVARARENIQERLAKYRDQFGRNVVGDEKLAQFEDRLRAELHSSTIGRGIREPSILKREIDFKRAVRERLDPLYWLRYVYGGLEFVAGTIGLKLLAGYLASGTAIPTPIPGSGGEMIPGGMDRHIWNTATEYIRQLGVSSDPSQLQILKAAKSLAIENNIGVPIWNLPGNPLDIHMIQGYPLKAAATKALILSSGF